jgi:hypothetical protein
MRPDLWRMRMGVPVSRSPDCELLRPNVTNIHRSPVGRLAIDFDNPCGCTDPVQLQTKPYLGRPMKLRRSQVPADNSEDANVALALSREPLAKILASKPPRKVIYHRKNSVTSSPNDIGSGTR